MIFENVLDVYVFKIYMKEMTRSLKECTLSYSNFVSKCLLLYFGNQKELLENKFEKVQVGIEQEMAQSERKSHLQNRGGKN